MITVGIGLGPSTPGDVAGGSSPVVVSIKSIADQRNSGISGKRLGSSGIRSQRSSAPFRFRTASKPSLSSASSPERSGAGAKRKPQRRRSQRSTDSSRTSVAGATSIALSDVTRRSNRRDRRSDVAGSSIDQSAFAWKYGVAVRRPAKWRSRVRRGRQSDEFIPLGRSSSPRRAARPVPLADKSDAKPS